MIPLYDLSREEDRRGFDAYVARLAETTSTDRPEAEAVREVIDAVRREGDAAVVACMRRWCDPDFRAERMAVGEKEIDAAYRKLDAGLREALATAIAHVRRYQEHLLPRDPEPLAAGGAELGLRFTPVERAGLAVPGGRASYPSTLLMLAVPALVAGVAPDGLTVVSPPPTRREGEKAGDLSPLVLAACAMLGIRRVYRIGGAQAIAALALGTETVGRVDLVAGPGNVFVQLAKQQLAGTIGIDGFYGPSEVLTVADHTASPERVAADLLAQAEHDPGRAILVSWVPEVLEAVREALARQWEGCRRREAIRTALAEESALCRVADEREAVEVASRVAAEHVSLAVAEPRRLMAEIRHGGEFFLGDAAPVAAGDYLAGPSHCLPTGTTGRFASGVSVYTFLKRSGWVRYPDGMPEAVVEAIATLAEAEGLDAHAASARIRLR